MTTASVIRIVPAERARVWRALTESGEVANWFWPSRFQTQVQLDPRTGGLWRITSETVGMGVSGEVTAAEPPSRLVYSWRWDDDTVETLVTLTLADADGGGTIIRVEHDGFDSDEGATDHEQGWNDCLDRLPAALA